MRIGLDDTLFLVTDPTPHSILIDIYGEVSLSDLINQIKGGLSAEDNPTLYDDDIEAEAEARSRIDNRDNRGRG